MSTKCIDVVLARKGSPFVGTQSGLKSQPSQILKNCAGALLASLFLALTPHAGLAQIAEPTQAATVARLDGLSLPFIANAGQTDPSVGFYAQTFAGTVYVTRQGELVYSLPPAKPGERGWTLVERFKDGKAQAAGLNANASQVSYIKDQHGKAMTQTAQTFGSVALGEVFPGVKVELRAHGKNVEKIYTLSPGADPARIRMDVAGTDALSLDQDGNLLAATANGPVKFSAPVAWQEKDGARMPVKVSYALDGKQYGYALGDYDHGLAVVIDPMLQYTYLGGNGSENALDIAIHPWTGDVYTVGYTQHPGVGFTNTFPGTAGGYQAKQNGTETTVFVAEMSSDLKQLKQATYFDGVNWRGTYPDIKLLIHPANGDVYLWGSDSVNLPGMDGAALKTGYGFLSRLSSNLTQLKQSTVIGFSDASAYYGEVKVGELDRARVAIHPVNSDFYFVGTKGTGDAGDPYVIRVAQDLKAYANKKIIHASSKYDSGSGIAIHPKSGEVYITGETGFNDFPNTAGGYQPNLNIIPANGVLPDVYVARLSEDLNTMIQATYLGGTNQETGHQLLFDAKGETLYIQGKSQSSDFPQIPGAAYPADGNDRFIARMSIDLKSLLQTTFLPNYITFPITRHPFTGELIIFSEGRTLTTSYIPTILRISTDLKKTYGVAFLQSDSGLPLSGYHYVKSYVLSPTSGELYELASGEPAAPAISLGGYQPVSNTKNGSGGLADIFIARYAIPYIGNSRDCLFDWAETNYPSLFSPSGGNTGWFSPYYYRYYKNTNSYVGVSAVDNHVYYLGPDGALLDVGDLSGWLKTAGCQ